MIKAFNWESHQSYKDRKPPWIRLHKSLLDNYEYQSMSVEARALLPMLWLLASEHKDPCSGLVTDSLRKISFRLRADIDALTKALQEIIKAGFFEILDQDNLDGNTEGKNKENQGCNEAVTNPLRNRTSTVTPETETETETETDITSNPDGLDFSVFWERYPKKENRKKSEVAWNALTKKKKELALKDIETRYNETQKKYIPLPTTYLHGERWSDEKESVVSFGGDGI